MSGADAAEEKFAAFNWTESAEWQAYLNGLYPPPNLKQTNKFKRKWFRKNIDGELPLEDSKESAAAETAAAETASTASATPSAATGAGRGATGVSFAAKGQWELGATVLLSLGVTLSVVGLLPFFGRARRAAHFLLVPGLIASAVASNGFPRFDRECMDRFMLSDALQSALLYLAGVMQYHSLGLISPLLLAVLTVAADLPRVLPQVYARLGFAHAHLYQARARAAEITAMRANIEIAAGLFSIVMLILRRNLLLATFLYWNLLRMRYALNPACRLAFSNFDAACRRVLFKPGVPLYLSKGYNFVSNSLYKLAGTVPAPAGAHRRQ